MNILQKAKDRSLNVIHGTPKGPYLDQPTKAFMDAVIAAGGAPLYTLTPAEARKVLDSYGPANTGHVFNLGHGISRFTPPENVSVLVEGVHEYSRAMREKAGKSQHSG